MTALRSMMELAREALPCIGPLKPAQWRSSRDGSLRHRGSDRYVLYFDKYHAVPFVTETPPAGPRHEAGGTITLERSLLML
jgi:hypothetical protein